MIHDIRTRINFIIREARRLDEALADAEHCEAVGDPALTPLESARLLVQIDRIASRLEALVDELANVGPFAPDAPISDTVPATTSET